MEKTKVIVYLKIKSNSKLEMRKQVKIAKKFCKDYDMEIDYIVEDYKDDKRVEAAIAYCANNRIPLLVTNDLSMISEDVYYLYDCYTYLRESYQADLVTVNDGYKFGFDIKLLRGEEYERRLKEKSGTIY